MVTKTTKRRDHSHETGLMGESINIDKIIDTYGLRI
jgi:hypothetical protein